MVVFYKKFIAFSYFFLVSFCINIHDANAEYCNSQKKKAPKGFYCNALATHTCPEGCYCTGGGNFTWAVGDVEKGCKERWNKITTSLNSKGVYLCPSGQTSKKGAKSKNDCFTAPTAQEKRCAPGCFCVNNGNMPKGLGTGTICGASVAHPISCSRDRKHGIAFGMGEEGKWTGESIACSRDTISPKVKYFFDDFSELYISNTGLYGFINGKLITMLSIQPGSYAWGKAGVYTCPSSYPASSEGAKSVDECYKYDKNGNKVYYSEKRKNNKSKSHDLDAIDVQTINTLTDDLQDLLNQVNKIASDI